MGISSVQEPDREPTPAAAREAVMPARDRQPPSEPRRRRSPGLLAMAAVVAVAAGLAGCGVVGAVSRVAHAKSVIDSFAAGLRSGPKTFAAAYVTTGTSPATVSYAARPPKDLLFSDSQSGGSTGVAGAVRLISNAAGEYLCSSVSAAAGSRWDCRKLSRANALAERRMLDLYTPAHWVAFLKALALAAGLAGDKVRTSNQRIGGIAMSCVNFQAPGIPGTSTICTAPQHILGYVKIAGDPNSFRLRSFTTNPPASLFRLPAGARITAGGTSTGG
jgi:hypothetical protein